MRAKSKNLQRCRLNQAVAVEVQTMIKDNNQKEKSTYFVGI
jgi:hypothetical protein